MRELFEQEYRKNEKALFLVASAYLHNTEDAKDILQDAALAAYRAFPNLRNKEYFKTWITRIVINRCKNFLKSKKYTEELKDDLNVFCTVQSEETEIMDSLCKMNPAQSLYITLRFYNDMTYEEMAKATHLPVSTVKYRTKAALNELKMILEGE